MINTYFTIFTTFLSEMLHKSKLSSILALLSNVIVSDYRYNKLLKIKDIAELQKKIPNSKKESVLKTDHGLSCTYDWERSHSMFF